MSASTHLALLRATRAIAEPLHVYFLAGPPEVSRVAQLDPDRSKPDASLAHRREIYLHLPNSIGRSKLNNAHFDSKLATTSTARNWRTVLKLLDPQGDNIPLQKRS